MAEKQCQQCKKVFEPKLGSKGKFCSYECYWKWMKGRKIKNSGQFKKGIVPWNKKNKKNPLIECACGCGQRLRKYDERWRKRRYITYHEAKMLGKNRGFEKGMTPWNKGIGKTLLSVGYYRQNDVGQYEHRLVMERKLGRKLLSSEIVHHIDGNRSNNHPDNLMLFSSHSEHIKYEHRKGTYNYG